MFKFKQKITEQTGNNGTLEMPLINCVISLILRWSKDRFLVPGTVANQVSTFTINDAKSYVPFVTLSTQDNVKLLKQLGSDFKITINWNEYQPKLRDKQRTDI